MTPGIAIIIQWLNRMILLIVKVEKFFSLHMGGALKK